MRDRRDWLAVAGIVGLAVGLPVILGISSGALDIPHNDDFDYRQVALGYWSTGTLEMRGFSVMSLIGQILFVQPFLWLSGGAPWAFAAATGVLTVAGLVSAYVLLRRVLDTGRTALALLAAVLVPGFLVNTTSFMTDLPAFASAFVCLAIGAAALRPDGSISWRPLIASLAVGCFGVSIRESTLAAPMAVVVVAAVADRRGPYRVAAAGIGLLVAAATIHFLAAAIPGQGSARFDPGPGLQRLRLAFQTLAVCLSPALVVAIAWWRSRWRVVDVLPGLIAGLAIAWPSVSALARTGRLPSMLIGNLFTSIGPDGGGALGGGRPGLYPIEVWTGVQVAAFVATVFLPGVTTGIIGSTIRHGGVTVARIRAWSRSPASLLVACALFTAVGLALYGWAYTMFDRYLWPLIIVGSALLVIRPASVADATAEPEEVGPEARPASAGAEPSPRSSPEFPLLPRRLRPAPWLAGALLVGLGGLSLMHLLASNAFSAGRWEFGERALAMGIPAGHVDAGMEWVGYYATGDARVYWVAPKGQMWYTGWWPSYRQCAVVTSSQITRPGYEIVFADPSAYHQYQLAGPALPLFLYRVNVPTCP
ncbi:MAG TPA: hypothetical protein VGQ85_07470 [Candidatus Limnocylindrales bacterium]|nr:hypothetical protein [Candidatus Limnocylindrales bacterium]